MTTENESAPIADEASDAVADLEPETPAAIIDQTTDEPVAPDAADEAAEEETASTVTESAVEEAPAEPVTEDAPVGAVAETAAEETPAEPAAEDAPVEAVVEEVAETAPEAEEPIVKKSTPIVAKTVGQLPDDIADDFIAALEHTVLEFSEGDIVEGTVVSIDQNEVLVDIGYKSEGVIPVSELSIRNNVDPAAVVTPGERIEAVVLDKEDDEGRLILSKKRAQYERAWGRIESITNEGGTVTGPVIEVVKGGLIVDIGLRGFLPASLVELRRVRDLDQYVGQDIEAKVIELDRNRNNVVLSRRAFLEEAQAEQRQAFLDELAVGEIRPGVVSSVVNFGAFVDLGGMDGLVHVSELSYQHVNHPSEVVKVGDEVMIKVLEVDLDRERISLSVKQTQDDPWEAFSREHEVGSVVDGNVTKTVPFGAFVSVGEGVEGLVHVSEIAAHRVESPELELSIGQPVKVKVTEMDESRRRVSLSIKQASPDWQDRPQPAAAPPREPRRRAPERREFEREAETTEERSFNVDSSLEAILQELKERGIGRR
ncbi:MAG TPA: 30S ribosomal protein S1 [Acidimicrobiia bacterium]|nr:30S ribosomal protein S1 [Acidimicrobiia bacterium]